MKTKLRVWRAEKEWSQAELAEAVEHEVVPAVGEAGECADASRTADFIEIRTPLVVALPIAPKHRHPDDPISLADIGDHFAIARLEDVQRRGDVGKEDKIRQRKERDRAWQVRHRRSLGSRLGSHRMNRQA